VLCICCSVGIGVFPLDAELLARGQYLEGPATGHLDTGFSWFPRVFNPLTPNGINMSCRTAYLQTLHFKYLFNKYLY
jgi:hypothetical protein